MAEEIEKPKEGTNESTKEGILGKDWLMTGIIVAVLAIIALLVLSGAIKFA